MAGVKVVLCDSILKYLRFDGAITISYPGCTAKQMFEEVIRHRIDLRAITGCLLLQDGTNDLTEIDPATGKFLSARQVQSRMTVSAFLSSLFECVVIFVPVLSETIYSLRM